MKCEECRCNEAVEHGICEVCGDMDPSRPFGAQGPSCETCGDTGIVGSHNAPYGEPDYFNCPDCKPATCKRCEDPTWLPTHSGSKSCKSGSIASGGNNAHCTCDVCF